jgi:type I restriction enzyme, S subunit
MKEPKENFVGTPNNWQITPIKAIAQYLVSNVDKHSHENEVNIRLCNYTDVYKNEKISLDMNFMHATATPEEISKFHLEVDDVVITKDSESWKDIAVPTYIAETSDDLICGYHLAIVRPNKQKLNGRFLFRCLQSRPVALQLELASTGVTRYGLPKGAIGSALIPLPPVNIQGQIADYIDLETTEIDALIAEKEHMLTLLDEKREALISHAVTRGLNPNALMKHSGLDWLGDIPSHWSIERAKCLFREVDDRTTTGEEELLSLRMHIGLVPHHDVSDKVLEPKDVINFKRVMTGQLVINRMRASMGLIAISPQNGLVSPDYAVFDIIKSICIPYFLALFNTPLLGALFRSSSKGLGTGSSGFLRLYSESFLSIHLPVPPLDEQKKIVSFLDQDRVRSSEIEEALTTSIALLKERRSALITAAVTGQIAMEDMMT